MNDNAAAIRRKISVWLNERLNAKLEKLGTDDPKYQSLVEQFQYEQWITDAARRVGQLQVVTHSLKPIHPDAKGSSAYAPPANKLNGALIGTPALGSQFAVDVVGNAAALDVFKFLKQEHDGKTLLEYVEQRDPDLATALSDDPDAGQQLVDQFATITEPRGRYASHTRAKQLYWLVGDEPAADEDFHLLAHSMPHRWRIAFFRRSITIDSRMTPRPPATPVKKGIHPTTATATTQRWPCNALAAVNRRIFHSSTVNEAVTAIC